MLQFWKQIRNLWNPVRGSTESCSLCGHSHLCVWTGVSTCISQKLCIWGSQKPHSWSQCSYWRGRSLFGLSCSHALMCNLLSCWYMLPQDSLCTTCTAAQAERWREFHAIFLIRSALTFKPFLLILESVTIRDVHCNHLTVNRPIRIVTE